MIAIERQSAPPLIRARAKGVGLVPLFALVAVLVSVAFRIQLVLRADFPLEDGGLFYTMARDIEAAHFWLPLYTSYNGGTIPFAYPPLEIYAAALLDASRVLDLLDILRLSPLVASLLTIGAFHLLAREVLTRRDERALATAAFTLSAGAFYWTLMGGGLTRSWGFLFAVLTIGTASRMYTHGGKVRISLTSVLAALTILSHPTMATFAAVACGVLFLSRGRSKAGLLRSAAVTAGAAALSAPWWLSVLLRFGPLPFVDALLQGNMYYAGLGPLIILVNEAIQYSAVIVFLGVLGLFSSVKEKRYFLVSWLVIMVLFEPRSFEWTSTVPWSLLIGIGAVYILRKGGLYVPAARRRGLVGLCLALVLLLHVALAGRFATMALLPLPAGERTAMAWIRENTPRSSSFLVLGSADPATFTSEWFPTLTQRASVTTYQGYEWRGNGEFVRRQSFFRSAVSCGGADSICLARWGSQSNVFFDHVYLSAAWKQSPLAAALRADPDYVMIYDGPGATVFTRLRPQPK